MCFAYNALATMMPFFFCLLRSPRTTYLIKTIIYLFQRDIDLLINLAKSKGASQGEIINCICKYIKNNKNTAFYLVYYN